MVLLMQGVSTCSQKGQPLRHSHHLQLQSALQQRGRRLHGLRVGAYQGTGTTCPDRGSGGVPKVLQNPRSVARSRASNHLCTATGAV